MNIWTIILLAWLLLSTIIMTAAVGKERRPVTGDIAAAAFVINALIALCVLKSSGVI